MSDNAHAPGIDDMRVRVSPGIQLVLALALGVGTVATLMVVGVVALAVITSPVAVDRPLAVTVIAGLSARGALWEGEQTVNPKVEAELLADGRLHVRVRRCRAGDCRVEEVWVTQTAGSTPQVVVRAGTEDSDRPDLFWPFHALGGRVELSSSELPVEIGAPPLFIAYELTGDCSGSPVSFSGAVVVTWTDLR
jgi:hypothetical protein